MRMIWIAALLLGLAAGGACAQSWEFDTAGNREGWYAGHSVSNLQATGGCLSGDVTGHDPYIIGPRYPDIDATANRYIRIRMKINAGAHAEFFWGTAADPVHRASREVAFAIKSDNQFHEYIVDMSTNSQWTGLVNTLRLDPNDVEIGRFEIDYIRVEATAPPILDVSIPSATDRFAWVGEQFNVSATFRNEGYAPAANVRASISVAGQTVLTAQPQSVASIAVGGEVTLTWQVRADSARVSNIFLSIVSDSPGGTITRNSLMVISSPRPSLPPDAPSQARVWTDTAQNVMIENSRIRLAFFKSSFGYGVGELYVRNGDNWDLAAALSPLSRISYRRVDSTTADVAITPTMATAGTIPDGAQLTLSFASLDADGGVWQGSLVYSLGNSDETIRARHSMICTASRSLTAWTGPALCAGNRSFGSTKSQALFPGLEWLVGEEKSSNTLESVFPWSVRVVPHSYKVTVPLMAVSGNGSVIALLWNALHKWDGTNAYPSAKFSSPNWYEAQNNHLMELFVPAIPNWVSENSDQAGTPYSLAAGAQLTMEGHFFARAGGEVLDAVDKWYALFGTPPMPGGAGLLESGLVTARQGFMSTLWNATAKGWPHAVGWSAEPYPEFAQALYADSLTETNPSTKAAMRTMVNEAVQKAISLWGTGGLGSGAGSHMPNYRLPYFVGYLNEAVSRMRNDANGLVSSQQPDGGWFVSVNPQYPELTTPGTKELGSCAQKSYILLRHARLTGHDASRLAGLKALAYMNGFIVPRAAQVWEVPQHAPDILAAAWAIGAYMEGYLLTGEVSYLDRARYWARAGLPFIYTWRATNRQVMDYGTIPVFGSTFFTIPWFGLPVQWCGMVYAYHIMTLADHDSSMPWRTIAEGVTRSCVQQMNVSPYLGTYPDSMAILNSNSPNPVYINPDNIYKCTNRLLGRWGDVDTRKIMGPARIAHISTGGRIISGCFNSSGSQLIFKLAYQPSETCNILISVSGTPTAVYKGTQPLSQVTDVTAVSEGWSHNSTLGTIVIKMVQGSGPESISVLFGGSYVPVTEVSDPAQAKALPDSTMVSFTGTVSAGTRDLQSVIYVQSEGRSAGIMVFPSASPLLPVSAGDRAEVVGNLATSLVSGERFISRADVRVVL